MNQPHHNHANYLYQLPLPEAQMCKLCFQFLGSNRRWNKVRIY